MSSWINGYALEYEVVVIAWESKWYHFGLKAPSPTFATREDAVHDETRPQRAASKLTQHAGLSSRRR